MPKRKTGKKRIVEATYVIVQDGFSLDYKHELRIGSKHVPVKFEGGVFTTQDPERIAHLDDQASRPGSFFNRAE